jgi:hypothetical protein
MLQVARLGKVGPAIPLVLGCLINSAAAQGSTAPPRQDLSPLPILKGWFGTDIPQQVTVINRTEDAAFSLSVEPKAFTSLPQRTRQRARATLFVDHLNCPPCIRMLKEFDEQGVCHGDNDLLLDIIDINEHPEKKPYWLTSVPTLHDPQRNLQYVGYQTWDALKNKIVPQNNRLTQSQMPSRLSVGKIKGKAQLDRMIAAIQSAAETGEIDVKLRKNLHWPLGENCEINLPASSGLEWRLSGSVKTLAFKKPFPMVRIMGFDQPIDRITYNGRTITFVLPNFWDIQFIAEE